MDDNKKTLIETAPSLEEKEAETLTNSIPKMAFEDVDMVNDVLFSAFHPDGLEEDEQVNDRFLALFTVFLAAVGWTEAEYWEVIHERQHTCPHCGSMQDEKEEELVAKADPNKKKN
jgi:hypothetical protein